MIRSNNTFLIFNELIEKIKCILKTDCIEHIFHFSLQLVDDLVQQLQQQKEANDKVSRLLYWLVFITSTRWGGGGRGCVLILFNSLSLSLITQKVKGGFA